MEYLPQEAKVLYRSKDGKEKRTYSALEWLAAMGTHVPDRGQQCVRYYGFYANSTRGRLRKRQPADPVPTVLEPEISWEQFRKNWGRLLSTSPCPMGMLSRPLLLSASHLRHPSAPVPPFLLPLRASAWD